MLQDAEYDRFHLPPITQQPPSSERSYTDRQFLSPRPNSSRPGGRVSPLPQVRWADQDRPHRSLKKVSRGHREWTTGLFDCKEDKKMCFWSVFCPCLVGWDMAASLDESCFMPLLPGTAVALRTKTRTLGGIKGSICKDWVAMCCCPCCALTQTARELESMAIQTDKLIRPLPD